MANRVQRGGGHPLVPVLAAALLATACASSRPPTGWRLRPEAPDVRYTLTDDGGVAVHQRGVAVRVRPVRHEGRQEFFLVALGEPVDPFAGRDSEPYATFVLEIQNLTPERLFFSPLDAALVVEPADVFTPLEYTSLSLDFWPRPDGPRTLDRILPHLYDTGLTLDSGDTTRRLLVFEGLPERLKSAALEVPVVLSPGTERIGFVFPMAVEAAPPPLPELGPQAGP